MAIIVNDQKKLVGIYTDGDLRRALSSYSSTNWDNITAKNIYTKNPKSIDKDVLAIDAIEIMERNHPGAINSLGVTLHGEIIGFVTMHDIIKRGLRSFNV